MQEESSQGPFQRNVLKKLFIWVLIVRISLLCFFVLFYKGDTTCTPISKFFVWHRSFSETFIQKPTVDLPLCNLSVAGQLKAYPRLKGCSIMSNESPEPCSLSYYFLQMLTQMKWSIYLYSYTCYYGNIIAIVISIWEFKYMGCNFMVLFYDYFTIFSQNWNGNSDGVKK